MIDLTARQVQILRSIIEEYIKTAQSVGSDTIDRKYNIGVSPATIRNEMVSLTKKGYLVKNHSSSGRSPTPVALKLYVNELMREKELSVADEVSAKEKIWNSRKQLGTLLAEVSKVIAERSHALGIAMTDDGTIYHAGYANLLEMPEFFDIEVIRNVLVLIEEVSLMEQIFNSGNSANIVQIVFGQELGNHKLDPISIVFVNVNAGGRPCRIGAIGSSRFNYPYLIPTMKYFKALIEELT